MPVQNVDEGWKQHFPTYEFKNRDIALEEYRTAAKDVQAEERMFMNASNIVMIAAAGLGSLMVGSLDRLIDTFGNSMPAIAVLSILLVLTSGFAWVAVRYFADRQKAIVFAARKLIILRRMLGLSYGALQLVLPNWRLEGTDEPFAIRLFPGWNTRVAYPFYILAGISSAVICFILSILAKQQNAVMVIRQMPVWYPILFLSILWAVWLTYIYRKALLDTHESMGMLFSQRISRIFRLQLEMNFEYVIYRATLARYELRRMNIDLNNLKKVMIFVEDRRFYKHSGISWLALFRALMGLMGMKRKSGGSTITQQLVRTLLIREPTKLWRRKGIELLLALWLDRVISKENQLELYLASVRFERRVYGILAAMHFFWGRHIRELSTAQSFFLIERVSNIHSRLLVNKISHTVKQLKDAGVMSKEDINELLELYGDAVKCKKIISQKDEMKRLKEILLILETPEAFLRTEVL